MNEPRFSEEDLAPSDDDKRAERRSIADRVAASAAVLAVGVWVGGRLALGACAAPFVFRVVPQPLAGDAMGAAFSRFDQIAIGGAVIVLGAEVIRTWAAGRGGRGVWPRVRRYVAIFMAAAATYFGLVLSPRIVELHRAGAVRGAGPNGQELDRIHGRARTIGQIEAALGVALVALHVFTLRTRRPDDDDDEDDEAVAPLPPGPR